MLGETCGVLSDKLRSLIDRGKINSGSFILFIDDGSTDGTWRIIEQCRDRYIHVRAIKFARNFGHQNALVAGISYAHEHSDCIVTIDADLQDDINVIEEMIDRHSEGCEIVYGVRKERKLDSFFKKHSAQAFYRLMSLLGAKTIYNHADYRLVSARVARELERFHEVNLFLRGIFPLIGFRYAMVYYDRVERKAGQTKYPLRKMISFALEGITSFSVKPLRFVTVLGFLICTLSLFLIAYTVYAYFAYDVVHGWTSTVLPIYFLGGVQLLSLGIIGEYIGKIYAETKQRPKYIIEKTI